MYAVTRPLVEGEKTHIFPNDPPAKIGNLCQRNDRVTVRLHRHSVDKIDDAILEPTHIESMHDMRDEWRGFDSSFHFRMALFARGALQHRFDRRSHIVCEALQRPSCLRLIHLRCGVNDDPSDRIRVSS